MDHEQLIYVIAFALAAAFLIGWMLRWIYGSMSGVDTGNADQIDHLARKLHMVEHENDELKELLRESEWRLNNELAQIKAERDAAMEGLGAARRELAEVHEQLASPQYQ